MVMGSSASLMLKHRLGHPPTLPLSVAPALGPVPSCTPAAPHVFREGVAECLRGAISLCGEICACVVTSVGPYGCAWRGVRACVSWCDFTSALAPEQQRPHPVLGVSQWV